MGKKVVSVTPQGSTMFLIRYEGGGSMSINVGHNAKLVQYNDDGVSYIDGNGHPYYYNLNTHGITRCD